MKRILSHLWTLEPHRVTLYLSIVGFVSAIVFYVSVLRGIDGGTIEQKILHRIDRIELLLQTTKSTQK